MPSLSRADSSIGEAKVNDFRETGELDVVKNDKRSVHSADGAVLYSESVGPQK